MNNLLEKISKDLMSIHDSLDSIDKKLDSVDKRLKTLEQDKVRFMLFASLSFVVFALAVAL